MPQADGRGRSLYLTALNKGKRSIAIDLRRPQGRELVQALATAPGPRGGVLLTNIGTPWLAHDVLAAKRADVITCTIEGNSDGSTALDYTVNCATGYLAVTGGGSVQHLVNHVLSAWDMACAYQAAFAIVAAVSRRATCGEGAQLRIALSDVAFAALSHLGVMGEAELLHQDRPSIGNDLYGVFGRDFGTSDGGRIMVAAISINQWDALVQACGIADAIAALEQRLGLEFCDEAQRFEARAEIAVLVEPATRTRAQAEAEFTRHKVCWGRYNTVTELLAADARASVANPVFERIDTPGIGTHLTAGAVVCAAGLPRQPTSPAPLLGTDTDQAARSVGPRFRRDRPPARRRHRGRPRARSFAGMRWVLAVWNSDAGTALGRAGQAPHEAVARGPGQSCRRHTPGLQ